MGRGYRGVCNTVHSGEGNPSCSRDLSIGPMSKMLKSPDFMTKGKVDLSTKRGEVGF